MKIVPASGCWALVDNEGDEITRRSDKAELQAHWDRLSAAHAVALRSDGGTLVEHRATMSTSETSAHARNGAWAWKKTYHGAARRKEEPTPSPRKGNRWGG